MASHGQAARALHLAETIDSPWTLDRLFANPTLGSSIDTPSMVRVPVLKTNESYRTQGSV